MTLVQRAAAVALCVALVGASGCGPKAQPLTPDTGSVETTRTFDNSVKQPNTPVQPPPPMLREPRVAVYSYLVWITYAYRILNSDVATHAFSPYEEVRVNSYVQYNMQEGRAIDQELVKLDFKGKPHTGESTATVAATEQWKYRYIDIRSGLYKGNWLSATYDSTYTVYYDPARKGWLVDSVKATPRGTVK